MATWPYPVRVGLMLICFGIGVRIGWWVVGKIWPEQPPPKMRNITPK
jgi:hypothetical protein